MDGCHPSLDCLDFLSKTGKVGYTYFLTDIAEVRDLEGRSRSLAMAHH